MGMDDMAYEARPALGISIGATNLAAVIADRVVSRRPVLTLFPHRPPEVGVPSENPLLDGYGLTITDFVDRVGDPVAMVAADGSERRAEELLGHALRALAYTATGGRALPERMAVTYPAHWPPAAFEALSAELCRVAGWAESAHEVSVINDAEAALLALLVNPGLPTSGIIAVCDIGGTGSSMSVVDAAQGYQPVGPTMRYTEFAGDRVDQALLDYVLAGLPSAGSAEDTGSAAIGALARLQAQCRCAKEQLASRIETTIALGLPEFPGAIRITRAELDAVIRPALDRFVNAVQETLQRNQIRSADLSAVALVGGGANLSVITTALSERLGVQVITPPRPHLAAAIGAALKAGGSPIDSAATALAPVVPLAAAAPEFAPTTMLTATPSTGTPALAWSEETAEEAEGEAIPVADWGAFEQNLSQDPGPAVPAWYRRPVVLILGATLLVVALAAALTLALRHSPGGAPVPPPPTVTSTPAPVTETSTPQPTSTPTVPPTPESTPQPTWTTHPPPAVTTQPPTVAPTTPPPTTPHEPEPRRYPRLFPRLFPPPP